MNFPWKWLSKFTGVKFLELHLDVAQLNNNFLELIFAHNSSRNVQEKSPKVPAH